MSVTKVLLQSDPFPRTGDGTVWDRGQWPCSWIVHPEFIEKPFVWAFRKKFTLETATTIRAHVTADERYELYLDGERVGHGPERGDTNHWFFESYDFDLQAGEHTIVARVWALGDDAPYAQMSARPGFLFCPQDETWQQQLATGIVEWDAKIVRGYEWIEPLSAWGTGKNLVMRGDEYSWGVERGEGDGWVPAQISVKASSLAGRIEFVPSGALHPAILPAMLEEERQVGKVRLVAELPTDGAIATHAIPIREADNVTSEQGDWQRLISGQSTLVVPPHTRRRVLIDLDNYYCAYPDILTSGGKGSTLRVYWQEALYCGPEDSGKGNRDEIEGKYFQAVWKWQDGVGDTFLPDGGSGRNWSTLWWQCGRYVEIVVDTKDEALTIDSFAIRETRYPLELESTFESSDERLQNLTPLMVRVMQMCAHETYMDCPFYEQLQYIGDTRLEVLTTYAMTRDDRLPRKALQLFDWSRLPEGLTYSRYPSRQRQVIPPFSLWWIAMIHDFAMWRGDKEFVQSLMPGVRAVLDAFRTYIREDGLIGSPNGWNFCDWVPGWPNGIPPGGDEGVSGVLNWHLALVAKMASELEEWLGESELAARQVKLAQSIADATITRFWNEERGLFADDLDHQIFSEHSQCLALLSGFLSEEQREKVAQGLLEDSSLARTTIYFSFYLFEAFNLLNRPDKFFERMDLWYSLKESGFVTTFEEADQNTTRSDCHAWGAHPLFHYFATLAGIRPAVFGFDKITIAPRLGHLESLKAILPHPRGEVCASFKHTDGVLDATIELPECTEAEFEWCDQKLPIKTPCEEVSLARK